MTPPTQPKQPDHQADQSADWEDDQDTSDLPIQEELEDEYEG